MINALMAAASARIADARRNVIRLVIGVGLAVAALILLLSALLRALFLVVAFHHGPVAAHLAVAGAALVVAAAALLFAFYRPRKRQAAQPLASPAAAAALGAGAVEAAADAGARAAGTVAGQTFDVARAAGARIRSLGKGLADDLTGERKTPVSRKAIINATLAAVLAGILLGRRM